MSGEFESSAEVRELFVILLLMIRVVLLNVNFIIHGHVIFYYMYTCVGLNGCTCLFENTVR